MTGRKSYFRGTGKEWAIYELDVEWAIDVARLLRRRGLTDSGSERSRTVNDLISALLSQPVPTSWYEVLRLWRPEVRDVDAKGPVARRRIHRVRELLTRAMAGLNVEHLKGTAQFRARVRVSNELTTARMLMDASCYRSAEIMYHHASMHARKFQLTDCELSALSALRRLSASRSQMSGLVKFDKRITELYKRLAIEIDVEAIEDRMRVLLHSYARDPRRVSRQMEQLCSRAGKLASTDCWICSLTYFRVSLWMVSIQGRPDPMIDLGTKAMAWLNAHPLAESIAHRVEFEGSRMSALLMKRDHAGATRLWNEIRLKLVPGSGNWVSLLQLYFLICTSSRSYHAARNALIEYETHTVRGSPPVRIQTWKLYRAFMLLMIDCGIVEAGALHGATRPYASNLERQCEDLVRDKPGFNAALVIYRFFQSLRAKRYADIMDSTDQLRKYAARYLRNEQTARTGVFLRMLATIPIADFHMEIARERGQAVLDRHPEIKGLHRDDAEIIPYEDLWELALDILDQNQFGKRR